MSKFVPIIVLIAAFLLVVSVAGCGMDFQKSTKLSLRYSLKSYQKALKSMERAQIRGRISPPAAMQIVEFEEGYRATHATAEELVKQWASLKEDDAGKEHLERLEWEIRNYTALAARTAAEFVSFLKRLGIYSP